MNGWRGVLIAMVVVSGIAPGATGGTAYGQQRTSEEMQRMQKQLNEQIMAQPFSVPDEAQVKAYIDDAQRRGVVPPPYTGSYWRPGYTCYDLGRYSGSEYLACRYYHRYYGRYYW